MAIVYPPKYNGKITSDMILCSLIQYLHYEKKVSAIATECGYTIQNKIAPEYIADLLAVKDNRLWEFEIKTSKYDFLADFKKGYHFKNLNHNRYLSKHEGLLQGLGPSKFWFVVPSGDLADFARDYLKENYKRYGLLVVSPCRHPMSYYGTALWVASGRAARKLHDNPPSRDYHHTQVSSVAYFARRLGSRMLEDVECFDEKAKAP